MRSWDLEENRQNKLSREMQRSLEEVQSKGQKGKVGRIWGEAKGCSMGGARRRGPLRKGYF